jgi:hypothetical protein
MLRGPNDSQPVHFLAGQPKLVLTVIRADDGARWDPGDMNATRTLKIRMSSAGFVRIRRALCSLRRRRASVGRPSPPAKPGPGRSQAEREFLEFEQGAGV